MIKIYKILKNILEKCEPSKKQKKFFQLVRAVQKGNISKNKVSKNVKKAAEEIPTKTIKKILKK